MANDSMAVKMHCNSLDINMDSDQKHKYFSNDLSMESKSMDTSIDSDSNTTEED